MSKLIKISTNEEGKQLVSVRELYLGLGLNKTNWSRWYPKNIEQNEYFTESVDFVGVRHKDEGNEVQDFAISLDFAKHLAMMARTEKSHEYRNYFLECEKKIKEVPILSKELQAIFSIDARTVELGNRMTNLENNTTINYSQQEELNRLASNKVVAILGGKDVPAYKELNRIAFSKFWKDYKRIVQVNSYKNTLVKDFGFARKVIIDWQPNRELELMIIGCNSQIRM